MTPRSLRARLIAGTLAWLIVALLAGGLALSLAFRRSAEASFDERLGNLLVAVIAATEAPRGAELEMARSIPDPRFEQAYSGWYWQVDDGRTQLRSRSLWDVELVVDRRAVGSWKGSHAIEGPRGQKLRALARELRYPTRSDPVVAIVAAPEGELRAQIHRFDRLLALALGGLGIGLALTLAIQVGYGLRPLRRLAARLEDVRAGRATRLDLEGPLETQALVDTMNDVLDRDAERIERARRHVGNLAHALKTPLAVLSAEAQREESARARRIGEQIERMSTLVTHYLTRAAAAGSRRVLGADTDAAAVASELRRTLQRIHAPRAIEIETEISPRATFSGERQDLEEMLGNLMDNACKWAASRVRVRDREDGGQLVLEVEDDGPGLTADAAARALERGTRLDSDADGSGLGLAITADLAELYGGSLTLTHGTLGGLCARLRLPGRHPGR